ncbi:MAG: FtsX-like permease family protein [Hyphomicrobiaceae bacterium]
MRLAPGIRALDRKLLRDLVRMWAQALAIALVLASGVATLILAIGAYRSLEETRRIYYAEHSFADVFATLTRAPRWVEARIQELPGVAVAEARIASYTVLDIEGMAEPATGLAISVPDHKAALLNRTYVRSGRRPEPGASGEVMVNEAFANAQNMRIGDKFQAILKGHKRTLTIVGTALSPEYIYAIGPGDLVPDYRRFAVMWMSEQALEAAFGLDGAFNSISLKLAAGAREAEVIERLDNVLERFGGTGAYGRSDQISHAFLDAELRQLAALSRVIPPVFLLVSAFLLNMTLQRMIALERGEIGLIKAVGYTNRSIGAHYLKLVAVIALVGIAIGFALGTLFGTGLTRLYGKFFQFPFLVFERDADLYVVAGGLTLLAAAAGALKATLQALAMPPAVAMRPPSPPRYRRLPGETSGRYRRVSQMTMMSLRNMARYPVRAALTALGLSLSVGLLIVSLFAFDAVDAMIDTTFFMSQRQDASLNFTDESALRIVDDVRHLPGVLRAEPFRTASVRLKNANLSRRLSLTGKPEGTVLTRQLDTALEPVQVPERGLLVNQRLAEVLKLNRGDLVQVDLLDRRRGTKWVRISDVIESYIGLVALMRIDRLNDLLDEGPVVTGVDIAYDQAREDALFREIKRTPRISSLELRRSALARFRATIAENIDMMTSIYIGLAVVVAFGVVYNSARIQLSERARDLASLRVLGFHKREVARVLFTELAVLALVAQPLGWLIGYALSWITLQSFSSDLYTTPFVIETATYAKASLVTLAAALASAAVVRSRIDRLDLIAVLKTRE